MFFPDAGPQLQSVHGDINEDSRSPQPSRVDSPW
jgi:hypothetical protein